jgi:hypothetical protein
MHEPISEQVFARECRFIYATFIYYFHFELKERCVDFFRSLIERIPFFVVRFFMFILAESAKTVSSTAPE